MFPALTAIYAALFGVLYVALSAWVVAGRLQTQTLHGGGQPDSPLGRRIRAHGNFIEYVPLILGLTALLEASGSGAFRVHALLLPLLIVRLMHPIGMETAANTPQQYIFRGIPALVTLLILLAVSLQLLVRLA